MFISESHEVPMPQAIAQAPYAIYVLFRYVLSKDNQKAQARAQPDLF